MWLKHNAAASGGGQPEWQGELSPHASLSSEAQNWVDFSFGVSPYALEKATMRKTQSTETSEVDHKLCYAANSEVLAVAVLSSSP